MPVFAGKYDSVCLRGIELLKHFASLVERFMVELLPPSVELLELARDCVCFVLVFAHEELHAAHRMADSSRGVEARGENKTDTTRGHQLARQACRANHRSQSDVSSG